MTQKKFLISLGDPFSVNIELVSKLLHKVHSRNFSITLVGSYFHWKDQGGQDCTRIANFEDCKEGTFSFLDIGGVQKRASQLNAKERGDIAVKALVALESILKSKQEIAVLTCPIDKHACHEAGFNFPGHTEFFTELSQCKTLMLLAGPKLRVGLVSNHLALKDVSRTINETLVFDKLSILYKTLQESFRIPNPRIAVCGLNPHCSDGGLFGDEEERIIKPAIAKFQKGVAGPLPADTVFYRALNGSFDAVLAMYHDQGLGPLKTVHFDEAVNITCGLPYLRVSPDHGPAQDLFLQDKASLRSMEAAWKLARKYLED